MASKRTQALLYARRAAMAGIAVLLLVAGVRSSWGAAQHVMLAKGREHGTMTVAACGSGTCTGPYVPDGPTARHPRVTIDKSVAAKKGVRIPVVLKPGTTEAVRAGAPGILHAWAPLGGSLLLAALVVAGGLRMTRLAWGATLAGGALLGGAFLAL
ncbi:hypothetical protein AR457_20685 [Streptomyces agglomeratus]|uniref:hypothetical protein n=1 Tax=Streptomyces agglomeratus TaxID=285458 RepID=UPI0008541B06|nr:hypothetical protein [Streptomyces agglomeratus]OEJ39427.1 hypothetical protein BGK70_15965 [Streptomyces agglomeratus]OEJ46188.1 hypothetical protein AR457_20685 [Streptomyces agglomeratus]